MLVGAQIYDKNKYPFLNYYQKCIWMKSPTPDAQRLTTAEIDDVIGTVKGHFHTQHTCLVDILGEAGLSHVSNTIVRKALQPCSIKTYCHKS